MANEVAHRIIRGLKLLEVSSERQGSRLTSHGTSSKHQVRASSGQRPV